MKLTVTLGGDEASGVLRVVDTDRVLDLSIPYRPYAPQADRLSAFGLPPVEAPPAVVGSWVGSVDQGSSVNSPRLSLCCHGNGTHTECAAHVLPGRLTLADAGVLSGPSLLPCLLVTVRPEPLAASGDHYPPGQSDDLVLSLRRVREAVEGALELEGPWRGGQCCWAVAVRALDTDADKRWTAKYEGSNAPYPTPAAMAWLAQHHGLTHLLLDLPSADREDDGGQLLSHRAFWGLPARGQDQAVRPPLSPRTITEMCAMPGGGVAPDGLYLLELQLAPVLLEATPSRPRLYPLLFTQPPATTHPALTTASSSS